MVDLANQITYKPPVEFEENKLNYSLYDIDQNEVKN